MYSKVLVPLDGSAFAERVFAHLERIVTPTDTELVLIRVVEPYNYLVSPEALSTVGPVDMSSLHADAQRYLDEAAGELRELGFVVHTQVVDGDVAGAICGTADARDVDLIAMTTHGRSGISRWAFGSVADRVIRTASQPIFLIRGAADVPGDGGLQRILVPLDGSELAQRALPAAQALAKETDAGLLLVRAVEPLSDREVAVLYANWESIDEAYRHRFTAAERYLEELQEELAATGLSSDIFVEEGRAADVILASQEDEDIDVIVMSTHGRSGLARWVYGSVADKVLRQASCPLLLIRARPGEE